MELGFFFSKKQIVAIYLTCGTLVANLHSLFWLPVQKDTLLPSVRLKTLKTIPAHRISGLSYQECLFNFSFWLCHNILWLYNILILIYSFQFFLAIIRGWTRPRESGSNPFYRGITSTVSWFLVNSKSYVIISLKNWKQILSLGTGQKV